MEAELYTIEVKYVHSRPCVFVVQKEERHGFRIEYYDSAPVCPDLEKATIEQLGEPERVLRHLNFSSGVGRLLNWLRMCIPGGGYDSEEAFKRFCVSKAIQYDMQILEKVQVRVSSPVAV